MNLSKTKKTKKGSSRFFFSFDIELEFNYKRLLTRRKISIIFKQLKR